MDALPATLVVPHTRLSGRTPDRMVGWTILLAPLWVLTALGFVIYQLVAAVVVLRPERRSVTGRPVWSIPPEAVLLIGLCVTYSVSTLVHIGVMKGDELFGTVFDLSHWAMVALLIVGLASVGTNDGFWFFFRCLGLMAAGAGCIALLGWVLWVAAPGLHTVESPLLNLFPSLREVAPAVTNMSIVLSQTDYFYQVSARSSAFFNYPTVLGLVGALGTLSTVLAFQLGRVSVNTHV